MTDQQALRERRREMLPQLSRMVAMEEKSMTGMGKTLYIACDETGTRPCVSLVVIDKLLKDGDSVRVIVDGRNIYDRQELEEMGFVYTRIGEK